GTVTWSESTYERLVASAPEPLVPKMRVTHAMVLNVLEQWEGQQRALHTLVLDNHEPDERRDPLVERAVQVLGSLLRAGVVEPDDGSAAADWLPLEPGVSVEPGTSVEAVGSGTPVEAVEPGGSADAVAASRRHGVETHEGRPPADAIDADGRHGVEMTSTASTPDAGAPLGALGHLLAEAGLAPTAPGSADSPRPADSRNSADSGDRRSTGSLVERQADRPHPRTTGNEVDAGARHRDEAAAATAAGEPSRLEEFVRGIGRRYPDGPFQIAMDLHEGFALNQPLSAFALAALDLLDRDDPGYALDVVSVVESTLDDPRPVLRAQQFEARGEAVAAMKADGLDYEERMEALDDVTWPRPLADLLEHALRTYRQTHPWVDPTDLSPKSVVRELYERAMTFGEFTAHHKLARAEGVVLRYLTDAYRALRSTVPDRARTDELDDLVEWLGELVRHTDSSLLDEWEALMNPAAVVTDVRPSSENRALSANPRALRVMVRQSMFRRVELLALGRYPALAALDGGLTEEQWADAAAAYFAEYDDIGTGPAARGPALFVVDDDQADHPGEWHVIQVIDDPEGDHDWRITAVLDLTATDDAGEPVLVVTAFT
ncbi:MAG: DUF3516 domain-containing protein, partial [Dermatophilaceae bacterium]